MESVKLGILGMGTVASGLINLNKHFTISKVLVKNLNKKRSVNLPLEAYTTDAYEIINNKDINIVVELIGGLNPAYEYIKAALNNKKHVVTANKALIATYGEELENLAYRNGVKLMYEASVGGGIPIINTIRENLSANDFDQITGIINGTTNYILTQMAENGLEYESAVIEAQKFGFAESDPSSDVNGDDAAYKIAILSNIAFGQRVNIKDIFKEGITKISKEDISYAKELGYNIKLLATASKSNEEIEIRVHPAFIPVSHPLSTVRNEFNAVLLKGSATGEIMLYGKGAGSLPTGSAVLNDIMSIVKNQSFINSGENSNLKIVNKAYKKYYIRFEVIDKPGVLARIASVFGKNDIALNSVVQRQRNGDNIAPLVFITNEVERKYIDEALKEIKDFDCVVEVASIIMVEDF